MALPDISAQFLFRQWTQGNFSYKEASGELGVPGNVVTHRIMADQRVMSSGTGEHAGHLIGIQFGAPGDVPQPRPAESQHEYLRTQGVATGVSGPWR